MDCSGEHRTWKDCLAEQVDEAYTAIAEYADELPESVTARLGLLATEAAKYEAVSLEAPSAVIAARRAIDKSILGVYFYSEIRHNDEPDSISVADLKDVLLLQSGLSDADIELALWACIRRHYFEVDDTEGDAGDRRLSVAA